MHTRKNEDKSCRLLIFLRINKYIITCVCVHVYVILYLIWRFSIFNLFPFDSSASLLEFPTRFKMLCAHIVMAMCQSNLLWTFTPTSETENVYHYVFFILSTALDPVLSRHRRHRRSVPYAYHEWCIMGSLILCCVRR